MVNDIGCVYSDKIDFWCTLHPEKLHAWQSLRHQNGYNDDYVSIAHEGFQPGCYNGPDPRIDKAVNYAYPGMTGSGSSGLLAVKAAQEEGFERIILAGVPMQINQKHFFDGKAWYERDMFTQAWLISLPLLKDSVRSLSGWTKELLGYPTETWFAGGDR